MAREPRVTSQALSAAFTNLVARLGATAGTRGFEISRGGLSCTVRVIGPSKTFPSPSLFVEAWWRPEPKSADRPLVTLTGENSLLRLAQRIGLNVKPKVGDPAFDAAVYVTTRLDSTAVRDLLGADARRAVLTLLGRGWQKVEVLSKSVQTRRPITSLSLLTPESIETTVSTLVPLAHAAQSSAASLPASVPRRFWERMFFSIWCLGFLSLFALLGQGELPFLPGSSPRLVSAITGGSVALIVASVAAVKWRGRSTTLQDAGILGAILLAVLPLGLGALLPWLNNHADPHPAHPTASVVREFRQARKSFPRLVFDPLQPGEPAIVMTDLFARDAFVREAGIPVTLVVGHGLFGWRYLVAVCARGADCPPPRS